MRKFFLFIAALCCAATIRAEIPASGKLGTCDYVFDATSGLLTISSSSDAPEWGGELEIDNPLNSPFAGSEKLKEVVVEEGVDAIGTGAFLRCMNLEKITFASTVSSIGFSSNPWQDVPQNYLPFLGCKNLKTLIFLSRYSPDYDNSIDFSDPTNAFDFDPSKVNLLVYDGSVANYLASGWGVFKISTLAPVATGTFANGCNGFLWKLSGDGKLTITGEGELPDFTMGEQPWAPYILDIREVIIGEGIESVGAGMFGMHGNVEKVYLPATLTAIGASAFGFTPKLTEIMCAAIQVPTLGEYALPNTDNDGRYIYVWNYMLPAFQANAAWAEHNLYAFNSDFTYIDASVSATAQAEGENSLYLSWLQVTGATTYVITLTSVDGHFSIEVLVDAQGHVTSYVRKSQGGEPKYVLNQMADGWGLLFNGLESGRGYNITILAKNGTQTLATYHVSTTTITEGVEQIFESSNPQIFKSIQNGNLFIRRGDRTYTATGAEIK